MTLKTSLNSMLLMMIMATPTWAEPDAPDDKKTYDGKKIYQEHCSECHGTELQGALGSSFIDHIWNYGADPGLMWLTIKFGIANVEMPAWKDVLSNGEIGAVIGYIKETEKKSKIVPPSIPSQVKTELYGLKLEVLDDSLVEPWSIAFIDKDNALVTDKPGKLYQMIGGKIRPEPIKGLPGDITDVGQSGLLDVILDPLYDRNGWIYLSYSQILAEPEDDKKDNKKARAMTRIIRGRIKDGTWVDQQVIFEAPEEFYSETRHHYGSRMIIDEAGYLFFSVGDRGAKEQAQDISRPNGKIHRIHKDGRIPEDNPFRGREGAFPSIFSYGHRNPQGLSVHPGTKEIWSTEHGPMGGDELNHVRRGKNFGWPEITYGINYDGNIISEFSEKPGMEQPVHHWTPSIAVCDIDFYAGNRFPKWQGNLLVTSLKYRDLRRLVIADDKVVHEEILLKAVGRMRSVTVGPDGAIYVLANNPALILRLTPEE